LTVVQSKLKALQAKLISVVASWASCKYFFTLPYSAISNAYNTHTAVAINIDGCTVTVDLHSFRCTMLVKQSKYNVK